MWRFGKRYNPRFQPRTQQREKWLLLSYPKAGRTWLKYLLREVDVYPTATHLAAGHRSRIPYPRLKADLRRYRGWKVVLLVRHPLDTLVSGYFHSVHRIEVYQGGMSDFMLDPRHGLAKWIFWHYKVLATQLAASRFAIVRYEAMREDTAAALEPLLRCWALKLEPAALENAIEATRFERMKAREADPHDTSLTPIGSQQEDAFKVRRGKVGGYRDYLDADTLDALRRVADQMGMPFGYTW